MLWAEAAKKLDVILSNVENIRVELNPKLDMLREQAELTQTAVEDVGTALIAMEAKLLAEMNKCASHLRPCVR